MLPDELCAYLFDGQPHLLAQPMAAWLAGSRRFAAFASEGRTKIRKKLRSTPDQAGLLDLLLELETAYLLLQERTLSVVYEPAPPGQARCPDFAVSFTTSLTFMVEVTRLRLPEYRAAPPEAPAARLADTVASKLGQLLPQRSNVLIIGAEALDLAPADLRAALLHIQQRAERNDAALFHRHHLRDRAAFFQHYQRLSEVLVRGIAGQGGAPLVWVNPQAKYPLPGKVRTALYRSQAG